MALLSRIDTHLVPDSPCFRETNSFFILERIIRVGTAAFYGVVSMSAYVCVSLFHYDIWKGVFLLGQHIFSFCSESEHTILFCFDSPSLLVLLPPFLLLCFSDVQAASSSSSYWYV